MGATIKQRFAYAVLVSMLAFIMGAFCIAFSASSAYAADGTSAQGLTPASSALVAQDLTAGQTSIPAPTNHASQYEVYSTYLFFNAGPNAQMYCNLYMEYRKKGAKTWTSTGYMYSYNNYEVKGLRPNTKYQARLYYQNIYTGEIGLKSPIVSFKTGPKKKPGVKSVEVRAVKLKKHWQKVYGYVIYLGKRAYYTYKIRTTVTLKKKPKAKYIMINGKVFKANKKKYTVTTKQLVQFYDSPRGDKYKVSVCTFQNKTWKGYSKLYQKNRKIK